MKSIVNTLFFILLLTSCDLYEFEEYGPIKSVVGYKESIFSDKSPNYIIKEGTDQKANYYFRYETVDSTKLFLVSCNNLDDNEILSPILWNEKENYFSIYISNSNRYEKGERIVLFKIFENKASKLLDIRDRKIDKYYFTNDYYKIVYTNSTDTISIKL